MSGHCADSASTSTLSPVQRQLWPSQTSSKLCRILIPRSVDPVQGNKPPDSHNLQKLDRPHYVAGLGQRLAMRHDQPLVKEILQALALRSVLHVQDRPTYTTTEEVHLSQMQQTFATYSQAYLSHLLHFGQPICAAFMSVRS